MDPAYKLLRLVAEVRMILGIEVITSKHIEVGRRTLKDIQDIIPVSIFIISLIISYVFCVKAASKVLNKNFGFLKMHILLCHAFDSVEMHGPTKITSTTRGEHRHTIFKIDFIRINRNHEVERRVSKTLANTIGYYLPFVLSSLLR